jgi:hypothetical protein
MSRWGLLNYYYYYYDKVSLSRAALHRIEEQDVALVATTHGHRLRPGSPRPTPAP